MSVSLTLIPILYPDENETPREWSYVTLPLEYKAKIGYDIRDGMAEDAPTVTPGFRSYPTNERYLNNGKNPAAFYKVVPKTPCHGPLRMVTVEFLMQFKDHRDMEFPSVKAAWAYLAALEPGTRVALYFH